MVHRWVPEFPRQLHPLAVALWLGAGYIALCATYVALSSLFASRMTGDVGRLARLEIVKGVLFVVLTGIAFVVFAFALLRRIATQAERLDAQRDALLEADRRALAGALSAAIAHDVNNILTVANLHLDGVIESDDLTARHRPTLERIAGTLQDLGKLSHRLLELGSKDRPSAGGASSDVARVIARAVELARVHPRVRDCRLTTRIPAGGPVVGVSEAALGRAVLNLILNAADATEGRGRIEVRVSEAGEFAHIEVHDDGPGVPKELRDDVFQPFFTTKWEGTGLGLVSVRAVAAESGGAVSIVDSPLGGAAFVIDLPRVRSVVPA